MLDQFPSNNPNPLLKIDEEGIILYANKAACPLVEYWGAREGEKLPQHIVGWLKGEVLQKNPQQLEIHTGKRTYSLTACYLPEENCIYIQGFDISRFRQAEEEIKKKCEELEEKVRERKAGPLETNEKAGLGNSGTKQGEEASRGRTSINRAEKASGGGASFLETLLNTIPAPVLSKDREGKYRECNEFFSREIAGQPREAIIGKTIKEVFPRIGPELTDSIHRQDLELLERGGKDSYETDFPCADGTIRTFLVNRAVFQEGDRAEGGKSAVMVAVLLDISELRRNERKIRNNVKFLETLLNTIPNPVFCKDKDGVYLGCNNTFSKIITGIPEEEILGYTLPELAERISINFSNKFPLPEIRKLIENSQKYHSEELELIKRGGAQLAEYKVLCADGIKRDFLTSRTAYRDEEGKVAGMVSVMQDITKHRQTEEALKNTVNFLEILLDSIPSPVFQRDKSGIYLNCNEAFACQIMGLPKEKVIGGSFSEFQKRIPKELVDIYRLYDRELMEKGGSQYYEAEVVCADGVKRDFLFHKAAYKDSAGKVSGIAGVMLDITHRKAAEETLRNTVNFLETLLDNIPSPVFQRDKNGVYLNCNEAFACQIMGLPKKEIIGGSFTEFQKRIPKELVNIYRLHDRELIEKGKSQYYETEVVCADGIKRDFLFHKAAYKDGSGKISGIAGVMLDITQRKAAEATLRKSEEKFRIAAEQTGQLVYDYGTATGKINWAGATRELTGYTVAEMNEVDLYGWKAHIHPEEREKIWESHEKCMATGDKFFEEYRFKRKDGSYFYVEDSSVYLRDESGRISRIIGVIKDISERKMAREILEKSEERFRAVAERTGQLVYDYNLRTGECSWEGAIEELTGYGFEEFQGFTPEVWAEHLHPEDRERVVEAHKEGLEIGENFHEVYRLRKKDGSYFYAEDNGFYLKDGDGKVYRAPGVIKDITEKKLTQEKIEESEKKFRVISEQTGQIVFDHDPVKEEIKWVGAIQEITGYTPEEYNSLSIPELLEIIHPEDRTKAFEAHEECMKRGGPYRVEFRLKRKDGTYAYVEDTAVYLKNKDGSVYSILGVAKDITERKLSTQKIEESEKRFRLVAEQTGQGVYDCDIESDRFSWAGAIKEITGYCSEDPQISSKTLWRALIHPEERKEAVEKYEKALREGRYYHQDYRVCRKDGTYVYVENNGVFLKDKNGNVNRLLGAIKDVTEKKLAAKKLEKSEERYRIAAEQTGQIVFDYNLKTKSFEWAGAIKELTGYSFEEFSGFSPEVWADHIHPENREPFLKKLSEYVKRGGRFKEEFRFRRKDGSYFYVEGCGVILGNENGQKNRILGVMKDITEQKTVKEKLEKNEERYRLAAEHTGQIVFDYEIGTGKTEWAGAIEEITGYSPEEFRKFGKDEWIAHIHPEERSEVAESIKKSLEAGREIHEEFRFRKKDGSYFYAEDSGTVIKDENGRPYRVIGVKKDITEQKLSREKLVRSEERYRLIAEHTGQVLYHDNYIKGKIEWAGAIPEITGYSFEEFQEITANGWLGLIHPEDQARIKAAHEKLRGEGGDFFEEYRLKKADGSYITVEDEGIYLKDEKGNVFKALGVIKDIAEKKLSQKKLMESEERFRVAAEQTGQIVFEHDHINDILSWAGAVTEITGYGIEEFQKFGNRVWLEHVHPQDRERVRAELKKFKEKDSHFRVEYRFRRKDGTYFHVEDSGVYLRNEAGKIRKAVGVIKDISPIKLAAEKLQVSEERFRIAAEKTGQLVYDYDVATDSIKWAGAIEDISGYTHEEIHRLTTDKIWKEHIHPEDYEKAVTYFRSIFKTGGNYSQEYRFKRKSGDYIYVEDCGTYLRDKAGKAYRMIGVIKNITERKLAIEELRKSEERFRIVAEQTGQLVYDYDVPGNKISWEGAIEELMGYGDGEFKKLSTLKDWKNLLHPEDRKRAADSYKRCLETGEKYREEYRLTRKDGNYLHVENRGVFLKDENGRIYRMLGANKDITQIKYSLEKVRQSEEKYRSFIKNFKGIAFQASVDFNLTFAQGLLEEITGYSEEEFLSGKVRWDRLVIEEDRPRVLEDARRLKEVPGTIINREYRIRHKNGKLRWVNEIIQNISDESGKPVLVQSSVYDVTERKEAEEALARTEEIRKKEIHHRIKNNLQVISSLLELQADQFGEEKVVEAFRESQNRVASMAIIHEELYRAGDTETLDFAAYLRKLTADLLRSYTVRTEDVKLKLEVEEIFLGMDTAIPLGIIVNELVSNALKHAFPAGRKGEIHVKLFRKENSGNINLVGNSGSINLVGNLDIKNKKESSENKNNKESLGNKNNKESLGNKSISNITNNIDKGSTINKKNQFTLIVSDNGLGFPENIDFTNTDSLGLQLVNTLVEQLEGIIELERNGTTVFRIKFLENEQ